MQNDSVRFKIILLGILIIGLFGLAKSSLAATYYVDYGAADDAGSGTSGNPWKYCPGDARAAGSHTLNAGDTVIFKGNVFYGVTGSGYSLITPGMSGASGNEITYDGNSAGTFGTGKAIIDLNYTWDQALRINSKNYITIKNFDIWHAKNTFNSTGYSNVSNYPLYYDPCTRAGDPLYSANTTYTLRNGVDACRSYTGDGIDYLGYIYIGGISDHVTVKDCVIHETQNWDDVCSANPITINAVGSYGTTDGTIPAQQVGVYINGNSSSAKVTNATVDGVEFYKVGLDAIRVFYADGTVIKNCNIGGANNQGYISAAFRLAAAVTNTAIQDNTIHDLWQYAGDDGMFRCHSGDWMHVFDYGTLTTGIRIERNFFYNDRDFAYRNGSNMSGFFEGNVSEVDYWNNIIVNYSSTNGMVMLGSSQGYTPKGFRFFNNTFINYKAPGISLASLLNISTSVDVSTVSIKNNIFAFEGSSPGGALFYSYSGISPVMDYNLFWRSDSSQAAVAYVNGNSYNTLAAWQAVTGNPDAHSSFGDPGFVKLPVTGASSSSGDYRLSAPIPGVNLSNAGLTNDKNKVSRTTWDIGAYEYVQGGDTTPPAAPTGLRVN